MIATRNLNRFKVDLKKFADLIGVRRKAMFQWTAAYFWNGFTWLTPVDTGRARSSWNIASGTPDPSFPEDGFYGPPSQPDVSRIDGNVTIWVTSNLPYIEPLENGHSSQSPTGMVMVTIAQFVAELELYTKRLQTTTR